MNDYYGEKPHKKRQSCVEVYVPELKLYRIEKVRIWLVKNMEILAVSKNGNKNLKIFKTPRIKKKGVITNIV